MIGSFRLPVSLTSSGDTTAPTILTATVEDANPDKLVVVFSEVVTIANTTGLTITGAATPTLSAPTGSGSNTITFTLSTALTNGQSVTLNVASSNTIKDTANNSLAATTKPITNNVAEAVSYEAEATTYMNALAIPDNANPSIYPNKTNNQIWVAVDNLVKKLKTDALLAVVNTAFLKLGNTANQQAINLKDVNANGTYYGGWIFNELGAIANGTTSYFDSGVSLYVINGSGDGGFTQVLHTIELGGHTYPCSIGALSSSTNRFSYYPYWGNDLSKNTVFIKGILVTDIPEGAGTGIHTLVAEGLDGKHYRNGSLATTKAFSGGNPNSPVYEGAYNDNYSADLYFKGNIGASVYHGGLTATQTTNLYNALNDFEIAIGRKQYV